MSPLENASPAPLFSDNSGVLEVLKECRVPWEATLLDFIARIRREL